MRFPNISERLASINADMLVNMGEKARRDQKGHAALVALPELLSAESTFLALESSVQQLCKSAPADHDVVIEAFGIAVSQVRFVPPHTLIFEGVNSDGHTTFVACHYSQLVARIVYAPKRGDDRVITGFSVG